MNQLKMGVALNYALILLNSLVALLYTPYMLRMMGQSEFGLYSLVASVIGYLTILDLGFGNAIVRYTAKFRAEGKQKEQYEMFGMFLVLYTVIGLIAFVAGLGLYFNVDNMFGDTMTTVELDHARVMMIILVFNLAFTFPMGIFGSIMSAYERFVFPKVINIARVVLNTAIMILLLHLGYRAIGMVVLQTIFNVLTLVINYIYCKRKLKIQIHYGKFQWGFLKEVAVYSFWIFLNAIMDKIYWSTGQFVLGAVAGMMAISIFAVGIELQSMYLQFSNAISSVFLPRVTGMVALKNDSKELSDMFIRTGRIQNIIMVLILMGFVAFGRPFVTLWAGSEYADAYIITLLFFISLYIPLIQNLGITILQARNQMKFRSIAYIIIALFALLFQYIFAKMWGAVGCAIAVSGALLIGQGLVMNIYYKVMQNLAIGQFWKQILMMDITPTVVTIVFVFILKDREITTWASFLSWVFVYAIVYVPLFYLFSMNKDEKRLMLGPVSKLLRR